MRMWGIDPSCLCRKHLLGEHVEMHMFVGTINKGIRIDGYLKNKLVVIDKIHERHDQLTAEMAKRGYDHKTALPEFSVEYTGQNGIIDVAENIKSLFDRCPDCKFLIQNQGAQMKRTIKPRTGLMKKYMDLAHKLAWQYHKKSRIDFEELRSAAYEGLAEAVNAWNPERGAVSTIIYHSVHNRLVKFGQKEFKHQVPDEADGPELPGGFTDPAKSVEFRNLIRGLSLEAQDVCRVIFESPAEMLGIGFGMQGCRTEIVRRLSGRWSEKSIRAAFVEIKNIL